MSEQALDLKKSVQIVRRHKIAVGIFAALGLLAGIGYGVTRPPTFASDALVVLPPTTRDVPTQVLIANSDPVLLRALPKIRPATSLPALRGQVKGKVVTPNIISISAQGKTAAQAESTANAVAASYISYVGAKNSAIAVKVPARFLQQATSATGTSLSNRLLVSGGLGALAGALIGSIGVLALNRGDRRLRTRDEIANAIGVPVLASIPVTRPTDAGHWTTLLEEYQPRVVHAWQLRTALSYLGQADVVSHNGNGSSNDDGFSVAVLSLASDRGALTLGPQLAVFAASLGIPTALVIGPQQDPNAAAALRAACAESPPSSNRSRQLRLAVADHDNMARQPGARLTVIVAVVDGRAPSVADTMRANTTVLGVSAGAVTAAQLVGVAVSAATDGRQIEGILVADPDPADQTTGRVPQLARPARRRMPTRLTGTTMETKR